MPVINLRTGVAVLHADGPAVTIMLLGRTSDVCPAEQRVIQHRRANRAATRLA